MHFFKPRRLTAEEQSTVILYSITGAQNAMLEYDEDTGKIEDNTDALVYATDDKFVQVSEIGYVTLHDSLDDALLNW